MTTQKSQYDTIAEEYVRLEGERVGRKYIYEPSFFKALGDVRDKFVADFGCGSGILTRQIAERGANSVVGFDNSEDMLKIAEQQILGGKIINNVVYEKTDLSVNQHYDDHYFDIVAGTFIFHYAKNPQELENMFANAFGLLRKHGRLVAINNNPQNPLTENRQYSATVRLAEDEKELREGSRLKVTLFERGKEACSFYNYHWSRETYERAMMRTGFKDIKFIPMQVSEEGIRKFGEDFWRPWYASPYLTIIEARK